MIMKKSLFLFVILALTAVSGFSQADLQPAAIVNLIRSEPITVRQLRTEVDRMGRAARQTLTQAQRMEVLDVMINERLAVQGAERDRITVTESELNQQLQQLRSALGQQMGRAPTDAEFDQALRAESGMEPAAFREQLRRQMIVQKYLFSQKEDLISSIRTPTEAEILQQYNLARSQFVRPDTVRFSMIQVPYGPDAASRTRARELAESLAREIGSNATKFDEVAARSAAPNSGFVAGDGGFLPRNHEAQSVVGADFMNTAFSLRQGEVSRLIEGTPGFQIIKVTENYSMRNLELDDILILGTRITVRDQIGQVMLQERQQLILAQASQELIAELRAAANIQVFERNLNW
jgi:parvulin-like peptidyl-prolyl isomerase